jgi:hypothetical protein
VAKGTAVCQASADGVICVDVADTVTFIGALSLLARELALKKLATTPHRAKRIPVDNEDRGAGSHEIAASRARFVL